ncbi:outer membrane beta-barrel protein [Roseateles sp.]|uniref:outer membrane beta-barrel protein n=1 Tax=Roseateles sp. TaxID=1971397 RepID=UPI0025DC40E1|nr:outer membrane beta-barrel protein [Roseateles sp.]MBV8037032.1 outer membrane beta-barrel protein [Roseateles sp.]
MKSIAITLTALALAASAQAQTSNSLNSAGTYGLLSLGQGHLNADCSGTQACDRNATGGKATLGYSFGNGFAVEGGYANFGKFRASNGAVGLGARPEALSLGAAYTAELTPQWGLTGRLGVARVHTKVNAEVGTLTGSGSENSTQPLVGLGVNYALTPSTRLELGVDSTRAQYQGERANVRMVSLGARMAF